MINRKIFKINPENPEKNLIREAARIIRAGGLVIFPAKCLYAIGADALNHKAVKKIFELKHRQKNNPILVLTDNPMKDPVNNQTDNPVNKLVKNSLKKPEDNSAKKRPADKHVDNIYMKNSTKQGDFSSFIKIFDFPRQSEQNQIGLMAVIEKKHAGEIQTYKKNSIEYLVKSIPLKAKILINRFWPGDLTLVCEARKHLPAVLTAKTGKLGIRIPWHPVARALIMEASLPVTGTSANISGTEGCSSIVDMASELLQGVDMILDAGILKGGKGSTVVDVTAEPFRILREGELSEHEIFSCLE